MGAILNGKEWGNVLNAYHSSSNFAKLEMGWIDNQHIKDGKTTKGEVKVGILNNIAQSGRKLDTTEIEAIIDKYAGNDGIFSIEEYTNLKNDKTYKNFLNKNNVSPLYKKDKAETGGTAEKTIEDQNKTGLKALFNTIYEAIYSIVAGK